MFEVASHHLHHTARHFSTPSIEVEAFPRRRLDTPAGPPAAAMNLEPRPVEGNQWGSPAGMRRQLKELPNNKALRAVGNHALLIRLQARQKYNAPTVLWGCGFGTCDKPLVRTYGECILCDRHLCAKHLRSEYHTCPTWEGST